MKTKTLILLCLLLGIGFTQLSAQSVSYYMEWDYWTPIYCDGVQVDYVTGTATAHVVEHYTDGELVWLKMHSYGEVTSESGEVFTLHNDQTKEDLTEVTWHFNLDGENGTHYIGSFYWNFIEDPDMENLIVNQSVCIEN